MHLAPLLLLPPSEGKAIGGKLGKGRGIFSKHLQSQRAEVIKALSGAVAHLERDRLSNLLGVRGPLLDRALSATLELDKPEAAYLPAWQRYTGVVWSNLNPVTLDEGMRERILVPSALYGLNTSRDPIADYRLKMSVSLPELGKLSSFWRPRLTSVLFEKYAGSMIVDLLPEEHAAAFNFVELEEFCDLVRVRFLTANGKAAAGHGAKAAKGQLARTILHGGLDATEDFRFEGWRVRRSAKELLVLAPRT
ncbi:MAG: peroxide stress protein YaaA [Actinomycetes bacterium]